MKRKRYPPIIRDIIKGPYQSDGFFIVEVIVGQVKTAIKFYFRTEEEAQSFVDKHTPKRKKK